MTTPQVAGNSTTARRRARRTTRPPEAPRDFVAIADAYAQRALADTEGRFFGLWMRLAASRYIKDRKRARERNAPFKFDPEAANDVCKFIEKLPHVEGRWGKATIVLHASHIFFLVCLFGFRTNDGMRRFTTALFAVARKNAKSTLAAAILIYCMCCEDEPGPQLITAATTGSQARIVFAIAKKMVERTPALREAFSLEAWANSILAAQVGGNLKPINSKASTQDGLNPSHTVLDEIHAHKTHDLLNVLQSAAGARINPLWLYTTTEGYETPGPWPELRHFAQQVLHGLIEADHFLAVVFSLDEQIGQPGEPGFKAADEDFDEAKWPKANPLMEVNPILLREIQKASIEAKQMPGRHSEFRIKRLNRQSSVAQGWTNLIKWRACGQKPVNLEALRKAPCFGGLDLSTTNDLTSYRLVWRVGDEIITKGWHWVPKVAVSKRNERGLIPYAGWIRAGWLMESGDEIINYDDVIKVILASRLDWNLQKIGYDDWNSKQIISKLIDGGMKPEQLVPFIQGPKSFHPAMKDIEEHYVKGKLLHGNDPVLNWCASNLVSRTDVNLNNAPDKRRSLEKIDDMVTLFMANGTAIGAPPVKQPSLMFV